jgi:flagellar motor switch protein FliM
MELSTLGQVTWSSAVLGLSAEQICGVVELTPFKTRALLVLERGFLLPVIERLLGGSGADAPEDRKFSEVDYALVGRIFGAFATQLSLAWEDAAETGLRFVEIDPDPSTSQLVGYSEPTLVLTIDTVVDNGAHALSLLLPHSTLEPALARLCGDAGGSQRGADAASAITRAVGAVGIELRAEVASREIGFDEAHGLAVGDVIELGPASAMTLCADATPLYKVRPGRDGQDRAVQIVEEVRP